LSGKKGNLEKELSRIEKLEGKSKRYEDSSEDYESEERSEFSDDNSANSAGGYSRSQIPIETSENKPESPKKGRRKLRKRLKPN
jgi:hypothetical protein